MKTVKIKIKIINIIVKKLMDLTLVGNMRN